LAAPCSTGSVDAGANLCDRDHAVCNSHITLLSCTGAVQRPRPRGITSVRRWLHVPQNEPSPFGVCNWPCRPRGAQCASSRGDCNQQQLHHHHQQLQLQQPACICNKGGSNPTPHHQILSKAGSCDNTMELLAARTAQGLHNPDCASGQVHACLHAVHACCMLHGW